MFELPVEIVGLIAMLVGFLVAQGVKGLLKNFGIDIGGKAAVITAVLVGTFVFFIEGVVGIFPPEAQENVLVALKALSMVLGMFGVHKTIKG